MLQKSKPKNLQNKNCNLLVTSPTLDRSIQKLAVQVQGLIYFKITAVNTVLQFTSTINAVIYCNLLVD